MKTGIPFGRRPQRALQRTPMGLPSKLHLRLPLQPHSRWLSWAMRVHRRFARTAFRQGPPTFRLLQLKAARFATEVRDTHQAFQFAWHLHPAHRPAFDSMGASTMPSLRGGALGRSAMRAGLAGSPHVDQRLARHVVAIAPAVRTGHTPLLPRGAPGVQMSLLARVRTMVERVQCGIALAESGTEPPGVRGVARVLASGVWATGTLESIVRSATRVEVPSAMRVRLIDRHGVDGGPLGSGFAREPSQQASEARATIRPPGADSTHTAPWLARGETTPDVARIANQVMRQIDERMVAWRERMGKF
ncbi:MULTISPECIES: hypothetical protein [unclassified Burkholderia]|uniref:hypothetical protein n=1 Tax=unclassified Burkholderia TaxID=2613784 RepID=UPI00142045AF|nr:MULTISPECIES: hypothetical protein [unclassified Burkholderia]NIE58649.1 hypothetical protein [Burkholderia sp. Ap-955]NIF10150.1 hypothetical protein [Burkholderia sp. Ax-1735]NIG03601.1 hypothetical protein [Burkholderia sp. Tr-849]